ncbi:MAG: response regulator [Acidobacteria bacterium]|nr:response regulator [Acidobacteriota bacterium]
MALRLNSLKTRTALAIASVIVVILVANAVYLILTKRKELRRDIENRAYLFALLTRTPICVGYETYYASGFYKFRELMRDHLRLEEDVERILIINVNGKILFDSTELDEASPHGEGAAAERWVEDAERLEAIKRLEPTTIRGRDPAGTETLEIIAPYIEDWGRHRLSVSYHVSYKNLRPNIEKLIYATGGLTLLSILASVLVAVALATRITRPLEELTRGAQSIAEGHFDRRLSIRSGDELQILAEAFNYMTERLKENVEQLEESNKKLAMVNEELKELDRMKSDLLANVSHELRTPLTAIKGYTDYILDRKLGVITDKQEKGLVVVQRNLERLSKSINALLDFSRMDVGRIVLNIQPFSLAQLVDQILTTLRSELEKKGLTFRSQIAADLPPVIADREKISQVIENLVINALKFTPEGGHITVSAQRVVATGRASAAISVVDTGIGIPRDQIGKIFNRFHQVDGSTTRRFGGVGLGLAIVKSILDAHGSAIAVESEEGRGTAFHFPLPVQEKGQAVSREERSHGKGPQGVVLVVDDEPDFLRVMRTYLEEEGFSVLTAMTAGEGAEIASRRHPDVILLDLLLPDRSGLDLLRSLKEDPGTRGIPVLVVSIANDSPKALSLGAAECLMKPVDRLSIVSRVKRLLNGSAGREPTVLVVDDETDTVDFIRDTLRTEGFRVLVAYDGRQALDVMARQRPDLILLDIMMPELSGFEVLEAMGRNEATAGIPVVVLTARGDDVDAQKGLALGARKYMSKPFEVRALITEVRRHIGATAEGTGPAAL